VASTKVPLTDEEKQVVRNALPALRKTDPRAADVVSRLIRSASRTVATTTRTYLTVSEVATTFGVTDQTVRDWVDRGWLPAERPLGRGARRIPRSVLASAKALSRARPPVPERTPQEVDAIQATPRRGTSR
jgi:excisionase family DNA binding protein